MNFSSSVFLVVAAALILVFAKQSEGGITAALSQSTEAEKLLLGEAFQKMEDANIMAGTDIESSIARKTMQVIRQAAFQCQAAGVPALTVKTVLDGILPAVRLVITSERTANKTLNTAMSMKDDPAAAASAIITGFKADEEIVFSAGVGIHDAQGAALALAGGATQQGLQKSVVLIQKAGIVALEAFEEAGEIANIGIKAGGRALDEAIKAAREAVATAGLAVNTYVTQAAQYAFDGLKNAASKASNQGDHISGIIESLKTNVTTDNRAALDAIRRLNIGLKSSLSVLTKKSSIDAANILIQGLTSTITETADAMSVAKNALAEAGKLSKQNTEAAVAVAHNGIKAAIDEVLSGSAGGYLGLGASGQIAGKKAIDGLIPAVIEIENGRTAATELLKLAGRTASTGLWAKGLAAPQGIYAAMQMCEAAGSALYIQFADAGEMALVVLGSI